MYISKWTYLHTFKIIYGSLLSVTERINIIQVKNKSASYYNNVMTTNVS